MSDFIIWMGESSLIALFVYTSLFAFYTYCIIKYVDYRINTLAKQVDSGVRRYVTIRLSNQPEIEKMIMDVVNKKSTTCTEEKGAL